MNRPRFIPRFLNSATPGLFLLLVAGPLHAAAGQQNPPSGLSAQAPDIYFAPTAERVADAMLRMANVKPGDVVYDLGSGDGRIVIMAAEKFGARGVGIELEPYLLDASRRAATEHRVSDMTSFLEGDLFKADISNATVVALYLSPGINRRLEAKLRRELRPGTRIVSHQFRIGDWVPEQTARAEDGTELYLWTVPRRPAREPDIFFVPTEEAVADAMLKLARVGPDDIVFDLGSGDGRVIILAAQKYGAHGVGIELDPPLVEISRRVAREGEVTDRATFIEGDLFMADISAATVVTLYLSPGVNARLEEKLKRELRPGTRIVSHQFGIGTWAPEAVVRAEDGTNIYLWTVKRENRVP
jgi:cyclopropane fatty-acyl-phospholipid synthase-like methyltransferase